jgi:hypothetical protein
LLFLRIRLTHYRPDCRFARRIGYDEGMLDGLAILVISSLAIWGLRLKRASRYFDDGTRMILLMIAGFCAVVGFLAIVGVVHFDYDGPREIEYDL